MARYIDAEKIVLKYEFGMRSDGDIVCIPYRDVKKSIDATPTADVVEVKYGRWDYIATHDLFSCRLCKFDSDVATKYCGGCGAKMEGVK